MRPGFWWKVALPVVLGILLSLWVLGGDRTPDAQSLDCAPPGYILATGVIGDHPDGSGMFEIGGMTLLVNPKTPAYTRLRTQSETGQYELVLRPRVK